MVLEDRERDHYHHHDQKYIQEEEERHLLPSRLELHPMNSSPVSSSTPSKLARFPSSIFQSQLKQQYLKIDNESHQYEDDESEIWWHYQLQRHFEDRRKWWTFDRKTDVMRWILTLIVGIFCGLIALFITYCTKYLTIRKFSFFYYLIEQEKQSLLPFGTSFLFLLLCHLLFAFISFLTTLSEPFVAGSGIPEVKCYLNGLNMPGLISTKTMILKAIGIVFACAAGLPLGKEGPMVHIGAVVAAEISQGKFFWDFSFNKFQDFRNDREKRDFVACGSAAGVAAAFGAPIGGVLFSLEESASYWSTKLTWRSFFCAMTTVFSLYAFNTAKSSFGHSDITAMFSFGEFFSLQGSESNYSFWELSLFIVIGCFGGFIGAFFNYCVQIISQWRTLQEVKKSFIKRLTTVLTITTIMTILSYSLPILYTNCSPLPIDTDGWGEQEKGLVHQLIPLYCDKETEYNELATLYLTDSDTSIRQLFHFREVGDHKDYTFSASVLFLFFVPYITMACITYGTSVPSGMFVPSLLSGAAFGRMIGHLLHKLDRIHGTFADSGTYALMGAASMCAGISRMTISLTVMILEATGDMQYVLPLMLTILVARLIGNVFTEGIYDMQIHSNKLNFLDEEEELSKVSEWHDLLVSDVMTPSPICMKTVVTVGECYDLLKQYRHVCFPIVDEEQNNILVGTVMTKVLCTLLKHKAYIPGVNSPMSVNNVKFATMLNWGTIEHVYPNYPKIDDIQIHEHERKYWLDLSPYLDYSPYLILESASVRRAYRMFRTLGLRQLCVINRLHQIVGIITREDLVITHRLHSESQQFLNSYQRLPLSGNSDEDIENLGNGIPSSPPKGVGIPPSSNGDYNESNSNQDYNHNSSFNGSPLTSSPQLSDKIMLGRNRRYTLSHTIDLRASI